MARTGHPAAAAGAARPITSSCKVRACDPHHDPELSATRRTAPAARTSLSPSPGPSPSLTNDPSIKCNTERRSPRPSQRHRTRSPSSTSTPRATINPAPTVAPGQTNSAHRNTARGERRSATPAQSPIPTSCNFACSSSSLSAGNQLLKKPNMMGLQSAARVVMVLLALIPIARCKNSGYSANIGAIVRMGANNAKGLPEAMPAQSRTSHILHILC
mmetsp:Transcript_76190/g.203687  ORF Transcript_76190/g.203687 Transcript_76190/m.203687 type:complete len:216 (+) Transcript_76190:136-783(+)